MDDENQTAESPAETGPTKTVEAWAEAKGYFPQFVGGGGRPAVNAQVVGSYAQIENIGSVLKAQASKPNHSYYTSGYAAARGLHSWPIGYEITEADFDAALLQAKHQPI
jgi:hypothetical protein